MNVRTVAQPVRKGKTSDEPHAPRRPMPVPNPAGLYAVQQLSSTV